MSARAERRLTALAALSRKQGAELEQARLANARIRDALERAEAALREAAAGVGEVEAWLRASARPAAALRLEERTRWQRQLVAARERLAKRAGEKEQAAARLAEAAAWLAQCARSLEATERLAERTRESLAGETRRRSYREVDELWLVGGRGRS